MQNKIDKMLFLLLRSAVCGKLLSEEEKKEFSVELIPELLKLSHKHDIAHLVSLGLSLNNLMPMVKACENGNAYVQKLEQLKLLAIYRYERINYDLKNLCQVLEEEKIPFLPLKGSILRHYYPEPWMRTSCDIDILVHEADIPKITQVLIENYNYKMDGKGSHDVALYTASGNHLELHYTLIEKGLAQNAAEILGNVWENVTLKEICQYHYEMPDDLFYFYHIAHMAKHFEGGGCGIRPFMDLWILNHMENVDVDKRNKLLEQGGLLKFAELARKLSQVWLEQQEADEPLQQMEEYILRGGVYGSTENRITIQQQKKGGRIQYALSKIFLPYSSIKFHYPILEKYPWLTPVMEVRRWGKLIFCGHFKRVTGELRYNSKVEESTAERTKKFLDDIGLS